MADAPAAVKSIFHFGKRERIDLLVSWVTLSVAFAIVLMRVDFLGGFLKTSGSMTPEIAFPVGFIAVATGFVFHELAHREAAKHYGFVSEFRAWYPMLGFALIFAAITGWILAAPGATYFFAQNVSRRQNGIISIAGPLTNIILGFIFLFLWILVSGPFETVFAAVSMVNFWFAFFNLLPILMLDGSKVLAWKPAAWIVAIVVAGIMAFFPDLVLGIIGSVI